MRDGWEREYEGSAREDLVSIFKAGLDRADPLMLIDGCVSLEGESLVVSSGRQRLSYELGRYGRVILIGFGKASARMALGIEGILGDRISSGLVVTKRGHGERLVHAEVFEASHPEPDASSEEAAMRMLAIAKGSREDDLVISCVSGGGSSLLCAPAFGLGLEDKRKLNGLLLASGAPIAAVNCVRKHLSLVKGGRLALAFRPATMVNLALSDVMGDDLSSIASGPTVPDPSTWKEAGSVLAEFGILEKLDPGVRDIFERGADGELPETPKPGDPAFLRCENVLVGTNYLSLVAAADKAKSLGYGSVLLTSGLEGEARELARIFAAIAQDILAHKTPLPPPACVLAGGESTVTLRGSGKGGRNQEMALAFLEAAAAKGLDLSRISFLSAASDGNDGPTDATGGIADSITAGATTLQAIRSALLDNDSYHCLGAAGGLLKTGPTNTNVCDFQILLVRP